MPPSESSLSLPSRYGWRMPTHVFFGTIDNSPRTGKILSRGQSAVPAFSPPKFSHVAVRFGHFQNHHIQVWSKRKPTMGPQTCLTTKNLNKCSNDKLCLMTAPPISRVSQHSGFDYKSGHLFIRFGERFSMYDVIHNRMIV